MRKRSTFVSGICLICFLLTVLLFTTAFIPPIFGRVVDAVTGKPIRGVNIALSESHYVGFSVHSKITRKTSTNRFGWFFFLPAFRWMPGGPLSEFRAYTLIVNEGTVGMIGTDENSAEIASFYFNPRFTKNGWAIGNKKYSPLSVTFKKSQCAGRYEGTCTYKALPLGISIHLIPVLDDVAACRSIPDSSLRESCREMNTYWSAFVHLATYDEVQKDKQLCEAIDHGFMSKTCLSQLEGAARTPSSAVQPAPESMFPDSLAGLPFKNRGCGPQLLFSGRVHCGASYGPASEFLVSVQIETFPGSHETLQTLQWRPDYADYKEATVTNEHHAEGWLLRYHGPMYDSYLWFSGEKRVEVFFYRHIPQESEFVSYYLTRFPSTLQ